MSRNYLNLCPVRNEPVIIWPPSNRPNIEHLMPPVMPYRDRAIYATANYRDTIPDGIRPDYLDINYHRGNFQFDVPGCPKVPGGFDIWPSLLMSWFLDRLPIEWQHNSLNYYVNTLGLSHWNGSRRHSQNVGATPASFANTMALVKSYVKYNTVNIFSGDGETWEEMIPWLDTLVSKRAIDIIVNCWQGDQNFDPYTLTSNQFKITKYAIEHGLKTAMHWVNGQCLWLNAIDDSRRPNTWFDFGLCADDRFDAMRKQGLLTRDTVNKICNILGNDYRILEGHPFSNYHYYQCNTEIAISSGPGLPDVQGGLGKVLQAVQYSPSEWPKIIFGEYCADALSKQLPPAPRTIDQEAMKGYLGCCTYAFGRGIYGFFNDATYPSGKIL